MNASTKGHHSTKDTRIDGTGGVESVELKYDLDTTCSDCHFQGRPQLIALVLQSLSSRVGKDGKRVLQDWVRETSLKHSGSARCALKSIFVPIDLLILSWTTSYRCFFLAHQQPLGH